MQRKASAVWKGGLKDGKGTVSSTSGVLSNTPYSFTTRFENAPGTNPEELIAAAHAADRKGGLKDGKGTVSSTSGVLSNTPYSFTTRFENAPGTNPEELIAAAHA